MCIGNNIQVSAHSLVVTQEVCLQTLAEEYPLRGAVLAENSELDVELLRPSFAKRDLGYFDPRQGGFLLSMGPILV